MPAATYSELRLVIEGATVVLREGYQFTDGTRTQELQVPSGATNGVKVKLDGADGGYGSSGVRIATGETIIVVDFDVTQNFKVQGNPSTPAGIRGFLFTPVLRAAVRDLAGSISGTVQDSDGQPLADVRVEAAGLDPDVAVAGAVTDGSGAYTIRFLPPGSYTVEVPEQLEASVSVTVDQSQDVIGIDFVIQAAPLSTIVFASWRDGNLEIYKMLSDGSEQTRLTFSSRLDQQPALSPDGTKIAYRWVNDGDGEIYIMDIDGSNRVQLTSDGCWNYLPAWSPDMSKLAFSCGVGANRNDLFVVNVDGTGLRQLTTGAQNNISPSWSPDGTKIVFHSRRGGNDDIYVMNADGSGVTRLTNNGGFFPSWSPTGDQIVFTSNRDGDFDLYVMGIDGANVVALTSDSVTDVDSAWSPDGRRIVFLSERDGNLEVYVIDADGSNPTRLTNTAANEEGVSWGWN